MAAGERIPHLTYRIGLGTFIILAPGLNDLLKGVPPASGTRGTLTHQQQGRNSWGLKRKRDKGAMSTCDRLWHQ